MADGSLPTEETKVGLRMRLLEFRVCFPNAGGLQFSMKESFIEHRYRLHNKYFTIQEYFQNF
jgi:hypothetical protein